MKIAFAGSPESAVIVLESLAKQHEVVAVLTKEDAPVGRKRILTPSAIATFAEDLGLTIYKRNQPTVEDAVRIRELGAEICIVVAYGALLRQDLLDQGPRFINLHFSLLPKFRGAAPVQRTILAGEKLSGISIFEIDAGLDTGPLLTQIPVELDGTETTPGLLKRLTEIAIPELMRVIEQAPIPVPQVGTPSYAPKVSKSDGRLNVQDGLAYAATKFRALAEEPGVWLETKQGNLSLIEVNLDRLPSLSGLKGPIGWSFVQHMNHIYLTDGSELGLRISRIQPAGKPKMSAMDWWRGLREVPEIV
jgi:methionyl-tRNA formyltransferase